MFNIIIVLLGVVVVLIVIIALRPSCQAAGYRLTSH